MMTKSNLYLNVSSLSLSRKWPSISPISFDSSLASEIDAARVEALRAMYPGQDDSDIMADLIHAALDELEVAMPYVPGKQVIAEDDQGDPIYEDLGPTPRFYILSHEFLRKLAETEAAAK